MYSYLNKPIVIATLISFALGIIAHKAFMGKNIQTKIEYKDREVIKNNVITKIRTVRSKDGSIVEEKEVIDKTERDKDKTLIKLVYKPQWQAYGGAGVDGKNLTIGLNRRLMGPVFIGAQYQTETKAIIGLISIEF